MITYAYLCGHFLLIISRVRARQRHISLSDPSGARRSVKQGSVGSSVEGRPWIPIKLQTFRRHKNHVLQAQGLWFVKISGQSCSFVYFVLGPWKKTSAHRHWIPVSTKPGAWQNPHQQPWSKQQVLSNKYLTKLRKPFPWMENRYIDIRPVLESGNKNQPQQGSPTSSYHLFDSFWVKHASKPQEPFQPWHIHHSQFCFSYLGRGCCFRKVEISGKPRASQTEGFTGL